MRRPNKPHIDGYEDEEDCEGYYDPDEDERRKCNLLRHQTPTDPCRICFEAWRTKEELKRKANWDAKTPEEKAWHEASLKNLRELY